MFKQTASYVEMQAVDYHRSGIVIAFTVAKTEKRVITNPQLVK
jgi:hypothetical protein